MTLLPEPQALRFDVGGLVRHSVASLYSHLVTRPTGRAVRLAIESRVVEAGEPSVSLVDFAQVTIMDFSCADEVVARLLRRYLAADRPREAFFVFRGIQEWHEEPIQAVLERQSLAAVAHAGPDGSARLLGTVSEPERVAWRRVEETRTLSPGELHGDPGGGDHARALDLLVARRLVFRDPGGTVHALSRLVA